MLGVYYLSTINKETGIAKTAWHISDAYHMFAIHCKGLLGYNHSAFDIEFSIKLIIKTFNVLRQSFNSEKFFKLLRDNTVIYDICCG